MIIGTRVSPLAMAQAHLVRDMLSERLSIPAARFAIQGFTTTGDQIQDRPLNEFGGKGLFTKELDEALLRGEIDAAVHSMKDLPTRLPDGLELVCVPSREPPNDVLISPRFKALKDLPPGSIVGTASLRRQAQILNRWPHLKVTSLRGSVQTRMKRVDEGVVTATLLALAGLKRLQLADRAASIIPVHDMLPAVGQGALAVVCRSNNPYVQRMLAQIDQPGAHVATDAERAFLDRLDGSCRTPIAALGTIDGQRLTLSCEVLTPDGTQAWRATGSTTLDLAAPRQAIALGQRLGTEILSQAGKEFPWQALAS